MKQRSGKIQSCHRVALDFCTIIDVTSEDCMSAIASETHDFEDALIDACVLLKKISCIVTRNTRISVFLK